MTDAPTILTGEQGDEVDLSPRQTPQKAAKSRQGDLTQGPILTTLLAFSIPMLISSILQTLNGSINAIWVGRLLGENALAATANANIIMFLLVALIIGFGTATTVRVGQFFGARDLVAARQNFGTGIGFCILLGVLTGIVGWLFTSHILAAMGTPESSSELAMQYLRVVFITIPFGVVSMMVSMGMRGAGDSKTPLYAMILTAAVDVVANPLLIMGIGPIPAMGIAGSAAATAFANIAGLIYQVWRIYAQDLPLRLRGAELRFLIPQGDALKYIVAKGIPMGAQMALVSSAGLVMISLVNREGQDAAAAYGASLQLWNYLQMPALAVSSAVSAMVAQAIGAGNHKRVGSVTVVGIVATVGMSTVLAAMIILADKPLLALFLDPQGSAIGIAQRIQFVCTASFVIMCVPMILSGTMRAYGAAIAPMVIMFLSLYPARLGFYYFAYPHIGPDAIWWAFPAGAVVSVVLSAIYYSKGNWRKLEALPTRKA